MAESGTARVMALLRGEAGIRRRAARFAATAGTGADITRRYRAEQALRESEERFRRLTALSSDWYWELDAEYRFAAVTGGEGREQPSIDAQLRQPPLGTSGTAPGRFHLGRTPARPRTAQILRRPGDRLRWRRWRTRLLVDQRRAGVQQRRPIHRLPRRRRRHHAALPHLCAARRREGTVRAARRRRAAGATDDPAVPRGRSGPGAARGGGGQCGEGQRAAPSGRPQLAGKLSPDIARLAAG